MLQATKRGVCMVHTSTKKTPSIYDEDKKKSNGVIYINSYPHYFQTNRELKKLMRLKRAS